MWAFILLLDDQQLPELPRGDVALEALLTRFRSTSGGSQEVPRDRERELDRPVPAIRRQRKEAPQQARQHVAAAGDGATPFGEGQRRDGMKRTYRLGQLLELRSEDPLE